MQSCTVQPIVHQQRLAAIHPLSQSAHSWVRFKSTPHSLCVVQVLHCNLRQLPPHELAALTDGLAVLCPPGSHSHSLLTRKQPQPAAAACAQQPGSNNIGANPTDVVQAHVPRSISSPGASRCFVDELLSELLLRLQLATGEGAATGSGHAPEAPTSAAPSHPAPTTLAPLAAARRKPTTNPSAATPTAAAQLGAVAPPAAVAGAHPPPRPLNAHGVALVARAVVALGAAPGPVWSDALLAAAVAILPGAGARDVAILCSALERGLQGPPAAASRTGRGAAAASVSPGLSPSRAAAHAVVAALAAHPSVCGAGGAGRQGGGDGGGDSLEPQQGEVNGPNGEVNGPPGQVNGPHGEAKGPALVGAGGLVRPPVRPQAAALMRSSSTSQTVKPRHHMPLPERVALVTDVVRVLYGPLRGGGRPAR